ncbi:hypothetical protein ACFW04_003675 [Cataglyphis niger]
MDSPNEIFQSRLYKINRVLLSLLGQWPFQQEIHRHAIFGTVAFLALSQAITQILALVTLRHDINGTLECIPTLIIYSLCIVKVINSLCNIKKV